MVKSLSTSWRLGLLALAGWLALPCAWWAARQPVPRLVKSLSAAPVAIDLDADRAQGLIENYDEANEKLILSDLTTGEIRAELPAHAVAHCFLSDGGILCASVDERGVEVLEIPAKRVLCRVSRDTSNLTGLSFSPDGKTLLVSNGAGLTQLRDATTGEERFTFRDQGTVLNDFARDGQTLLTYVVDADRVLIRESGTGQLRMEVAGCKGHWSFCKDGRFLAVSTLAGGALWDVHRGQLVKQYSKSEKILDASPGAHYLAMERWQGTDWKWPTWLPSQILRVLPAQWQPTGHTLEVIEVATGESLACLPLASEAEFLADGKTLMTYDHDASILRLWDVPPRMVVPGPTPWIVFLIAFFLSCAWTRTRRRARSRTAIAGP